MIVIKTNEALLRTKIQEFHEYIASKQLEIKSTNPITTSIASYNAVYWEGKGGYGYGYGVSQVVGMLVLLQRTDEISEGEYQKRLEKRKLESVLSELREARDKAQAQVSADNQLDTSIIEKKKLFGGYKYLVNTQEFDSKDLAEQYVQNLKKQSSIRYREFEKAEKALQQAENKLSLLQEK